MPQATGPIALTAGTPFFEQAPQGLLNPTAVVAINKSYFDITFSAPISKTVPAWTADLVSAPNPIPGSASAGAVGTVSGVPSLTPGSPTPTSGASSLYLNWYAAGEQLPGTPFGLVADALYALSGSIQTYGAQVELTNSPHTFQGSPVNQTFPIPAGSPSLDGITIIPVPNLAGAVNGEISIVGATTGAIYLNTTAIGSYPYTCDFSSVADPGGVILKYTHSGGAGSGTEIHVLGLNRSQIVRPIHGGMAEGPTNQATATGTSATQGILAVPANGQYRIWSIDLTAVNLDAAAARGGYVFNGVGRLMTCFMGPNGGSQGKTLSFPGGYPISNSDTLTLGEDLNVTAQATVFYSVDA